MKNFILNKKSFLLDETKSPYLSNLVNYSKIDNKIPIEIENDQIVVKLDISDETIENYVNFLNLTPFDIRDEEHSYEFYKIMNFMGHTEFESSFCHFGSYSRIFLYNKWNKCDQNHNFNYLFGYKYIGHSNRCGSMDKCYFIDEESFCKMRDDYRIIDTNNKYDDRIIVMGCIYSISLFKRIFNSIEEILNFISNESEIPDSREFLFDIINKITLVSDKYYYCQENKIVHLELNKFSEQYFKNVLDEIRFEFDIYLPHITQSNINFIKINDYFIKKYKLFLNNNNANTNNNNNHNHTNNIIFNLNVETSEITKLFDELRIENNVSMIRSFYPHHEINNIEKYKSVKDFHRKLHPINSTIILKFLDSKYNNIYSYLHSLYEIENDVFFNFIVGKYYDVKIDPSILSIKFKEKPLSYEEFYSMSEYYIL